MEVAQRLLGVLAVALVAAGLVVGLMPVTASIYDCGAPLKANHSKWRAHDDGAAVVNRAGGNDPGDKDATCSSRVSGPRTTAVALLVAGAVVLAGAVSVAFRQRQLESQVPST